MITCSKKGDKYVFQKQGVYFSLTAAQCKEMRDLLIEICDQNGVHCPKCGLYLACGCGSCRKRNGDKENMMIWHTDGEVEECPSCGFAAHADGWLDIEYEQLRKTETQDTQETQRSDEGVV